MRSRREKRGPIAVPTASMGDIAFLLTIFFILCSNFAKETGIRYQPPRSPDVDKVKEGPISVVIDQNGKLYLNGKNVEAAKDIQEKISTWLAGKADASSRNVMFKCDLAVKREVFEPVLDAIVSSGGVIVAVGEKKSLK